MNEWTIMNELLFFALFVLFKEKQVVIEPSQDISTCGPAEILSCSS